MNAKLSGIRQHCVCVCGWDIDPELAGIIHCMCIVLVRAG